MSRVQKGGRFPLKLDDADWWKEWVVTASVALGIFLIINAHAHKSVSVSQIILTLVAVLVGWGFLPIAANVYVLDTENKVRSWKRLVPLNIAAVLILTATVAVGVKIYG